MGMGIHKSRHGQHVMAVDDFIVLFFFWVLREFFDIFVFYSYILVFGDFSVLHKADIFNENFHDSLLQSSPRYFLWASVRVSIL